MAKIFHNLVFSRQTTTLDNATHDIFHSDTLSVVLWVYFQARLLLVEKLVARNYSASKMWRLLSWVVSSWRFWWYGDEDTSTRKFILARGNTRLDWFVCAQWASENIFVVERWWVVLMMIAPGNKSHSHKRFAR